jgi:hypothetical protein
MFDVVVVYHSETNYQQHLVVVDRLRQHAEGPYNLYVHDNSQDNIGFGPACNIEVAKGHYPFIALLNPDCWVEGPFFGIVLDVFADPRIKITGGNFNKNPVEIKDWGCKDWVCGAAMFVRRDWWNEMGGFDPQFVWSHEETDLIRRSETAGGVVKSLGPEELPILHSSPAIESPEDSAYKQYWMGEGARRFHEKWNQK